MTNGDVTYECNQCGQEFIRKDEAEEHVAWQHDVFAEYIDTIDPSKRATAGGGD